MGDDRWVDDALAVLDGRGDLGGAVYDRREPVRVAAATRVDLDARMLADLACDASPSVRAIVASRPDLPDGLMEDLSYDPVPEVRRVLAGREGLPRTVRRRLSEDLDAGVQEALGNGRAARLLRLMPCEPLARQRHARGVKILFGGRG